MEAKHNTVLVVDDDPTNRKVLRVFLRKYGYDIIEAENGLQAVKLFATEKPGIVFMDVMMPVMNGYESTRLIKAFAGDTFVPVIFLTALQDDESLAKCIEAGGDDFLTKPYNPTTLKSKIDAMQRIAGLSRRIQLQNAELRLLHDERGRADEIAQALFNRALAANSLVVDKIHSLLRPATTFNGDFLLAAYRPGGGLNILLGDFTGHGLAAAIGAMPVSDVFHAMTAKGFGHHEILKQINRRMHSLLPKDMFLAACFVGLDKDINEVEIWNAGMPEVLMVDGATGKVRQRVISQHIPFGIVADLSGPEGFDSLPVQIGDSLLLCSDGLIEARNTGGEEFGDARLTEAVERRTKDQDIFTNVIARFEEFCQGTSQLDDISLIEIPCQRDLVPGIMPTQAPSQYHDIQITDAEDVWRWSLCLRAQSLRTIDPLPIALGQLLQIPGIAGHPEHQQLFYTVLAELYSNALNHGVLELDSAIKSTPDGFELYYKMRDERLAAISDGYVKIDIEYLPASWGGWLRVKIEDSGTGFDPLPYMEWRSDEKTPSGRGICLVRSLCESLEYHGCGNQVQAVYACGNSQKTESGPPAGTVAR